MSTAVDALAASPFRHLADADLLRLVADLVTDDDALAVALVCRPLRDAIFAHYPKPAEGGQLDPPPRRLRTAARAYASPVSRLRWALDEAGCPVYGSLLLRAAEAGDVHSLEHLWQLSPSHGAHQIEDSPSVSAPTTSPPRPTRLARPPNWPAHWPVHELEPPSTSADTLPRHSDGPQLCEAAAMGGHLAALQLLRAKGCGWDSAVTNSACIHGHLPVLRWANAQGCPIHALACHLAAAHGHVHIVQFLRRAGLPWYARTAAEAARGGHLHMLRWLREQGCSWDERVCALAAAGGHLEVLKWARENGAPWDASTFLMAARNGRLDVLRWLHQHGCPMAADACFIAAGFAEPAVLQWLRAHGCPWDRDVCLELAQESQLSWRVAEWIEQQT